MLPALLVVAAAGADFPKAFHVAGIPGAKRGQRVNLTLGADELLFERRNLTYRVPYARIRQVLLLRAERNYEKSTAAAGAVTGALGVPFGMMMILNKHKVDALVVDYENERHGDMGLVVQVERGQGEEFGRVLKQHAVKVVEPPAEEARR